MSEKESQLAVHTMSALHGDDDVEVKEAAMATVDG